jgi:hypothetical protein
MRKQEPDLPHPATDCPKYLCQRDRIELDL